MDKEAALKIARDLPSSAKVLDVGAGDLPFPRADYVLDAIDYEKRGRAGTIDLGTPERFSKETWVKLDFCERNPWPFPDKFFDFAICSHVLEDVRDPIWLCSELSRCAKAGYIETPSRILEQSLGVENPCYAGYYHHRWLVSVKNNMLEFRHKPHLLHSLKKAIVARVDASSEIDPKLAILQHYWQGTLEAKELLEFNELRVGDELIAFASSIRTQRKVTVSRNLDIVAKLKRKYFYWRLSYGRR